MKLRITTFNCENLFGRYRFLDTPQKGEIKDYEKSLQITETTTLEPGRSGRIKPAILNKQQRTNTANAILEADPHVLAVEEVENLTVLRLFNAKYMGSAFDRIILVDGNDARGIDVGFLVRKGVDVTVLDVRTHADEAIGGGFLAKSNRLDTAVTAQAIFSRDCLEVDVQVSGVALTFLVNHFKAQDNKPTTSARRKRQAARVVELVQAVRNNDRHPIVMGDLNIDSKQSDYDGSLDPLLDLSTLHDPFAGLDQQQRWTHFYSSDKTVSKLDYVLVDDFLSNRVDSVDIFRKGLSKKCKQYKGPRLSSMKNNDLEASDHCPTTMILNL
ncbi:MAG TPA: endonuclease/exonuclease/phosphatase family protein [Terriglobales bacterium]|nr:endonuclease/exonuclease/phosphatase family protein [Terriglobales bacterium]